MKLALTFGFILLSLGASSHASSPFAAFSLKKEDGLELESLLLA